MLATLALDAIVEFLLGPKIKSMHEIMCKHINGGSGILTSIGWVDLETNQGQNAHCFGRELQQSMLTGLAVLGLISKLQTPSDESRLMGEPP